ncbi:multidrug effflux MFS transporter [Neptunomonas japonica]|uniref:MFS transporter, DHA1 family, bicyclomycin/chloramphenicol resistance protein n=1 Tax=Neptunomonas japonica JAMM 1380 TaxID=1441457 RepID=A0A7R6PIU4_9GAMM|nr:multidrug effflux MFS transporter [Neptunomonas japonica]BBB29901.1 MFS transporter, DHA1 family, bicyclomycin/chloramphenicol resistance protein [Neptunomonas japonica JAMM 1380]
MKPIVKNTATAATPVSLLAGMAIASPVALNIFAPVMPELAVTFNTSTFTIQLGFTLYLFTLAIGQLISGPLADRYGRRPVLLWGFILHIAGCLLGIMAAEAWQLLLARVLQAAGGCTGMLLARSIVLDQHGKDQAAGMLGYITLGIASAQAIAPTMGGYLSLLAGWQSVFWLSMALGSIIWLGALLYLPESDKIDQNSKGFLDSFKRYNCVLSSPGYLWYALSCTMIACGFFIFITSAPFVVAKHMQGSPVDYGNWFILVAGGFWLGSLTAGKVSAKAGTNRMIKLGNYISGAGSLLMLGLFIVDSPSYLSLFLPMALFTFGRGLSQPNAQASAISATSGAKATATGMLGFLQLLIGSLMAQLTPLLMKMGLVVLPLVLLSMVLLAAYCYYRGVKACTAC